LLRWNFAKTDLPLSSRLKQPYPTAQLRGIAAVKSASLEPNWAMMKYEVSETVDTKDYQFLTE
jgi:hypothetical protein